MGIQVHDNPDKGRFDVTVEGQQAGFAEYRLRSKTIYFFYHTEVDEAFGGQGVGSQLVRTALDEVRDRGGSVVPTCPFFAAWIGKHPDYNDLVDHKIWDRVKAKNAD